MPLCSAYHAVIFSSHISAVIWYCIKTWENRYKVTEKNILQLHKQTLATAENKQTKQEWKKQQPNNPFIQLHYKVKCAGKFFFFVWTHSFRQELILCQETRLVKIWVIVPVLRVRSRGRELEIKDKDEKYSRQKGMRVFIFNVRKAENEV